MTKKVGSPLYIAPDVLSGNYDKQCDMWSAGCVLFVLLGGYPPFKGEKPIDIVRNVLKMEYEFDAKFWQGISELAKELVKKLMCPRENRLNAVEALAHPWFRSKYFKTDITLKQLQRFETFCRALKPQQNAMTAVATQVNTIEELSDIFVALSTKGKIDFSHFCAVTENLREMKKLAMENSIENLEFSQFLGAIISDRDEGTIKSGYFLAKTSGYEKFAK